MFDNEIVASVVQMYKEGKRPSEILRKILLQFPEASVPDLMKLMQEAFALPYPAVQCIGGWWYDGTGELSDEELDSFLISEILTTPTQGGRGHRDSSAD